MNWFFFSRSWWITAIRQSWCDSYIFMYRKGKRKADSFFITEVLGQISVGTTLWPECVNPSINMSSTKHFRYVLILFQKQMQNNFLILGHFCTCFFSVFPSEMYLISRITFLDIHMLLFGLYIIVGAFWVSPVSLLFLNE